MQWSAIVAAIGFARVHLNRDHRWRATLADSVFPVYIVHQTLIVGLAMALAPLRWPPALEGPLLAALTLAPASGSTWPCAACAGCGRCSAWARKRGAPGPSVRPAPRGSR